MYAQALALAATSLHEVIACDPDDRDQKSLGSQGCDGKLVHVRSSLLGCNPQRPRSHGGSQHITAGQGGSEGVHESWRVTSAGARSMATAEALEAGLCIGLLDSTRLPPLLKPLQPRELLM